VCFVVAYTVNTFSRILGMLVLECRAMKDFLVGLVVRCIRCEQELCETWILDEEARCYILLNRLRRCVGDRFDLTQRVLGEDVCLINRGYGPLGGTGGGGCSYMFCPVVCLGLDEVCFEGDVMRVDLSTLELVVDDVFRFFVGA
jgi:hypothetical protein